MDYSSMDSSSVKAYTATQQTESTMTRPAAVRYNPYPVAISPNIICINNNA